MKVPGAGYRGDWPAGWLDYRFDLFERYCLPSLRAQTSQQFRWLIFCDDQTGREYLERLESASPNIEIVLCPAPGREPPAATSVGEKLDDRRIQGAASARIYPFVHSDTDIALSTRLDNDDAIHIRFVERVQGHIDSFASSPHGKWLHNFPDGYKLDALALRLFEARLPNSAFLTLFERRGEEPFRGALSGNHSTFREQFVSEQDDSLRGWLQVIHGGNVLNQIAQRDVEVTLDALDEQFGLSAADLRDQPLAHTVRPVSE